MVLVNMTAGENINVFTLNCWGIPAISKDRKERMVAIADKLTSEEYDLVCLQEVWSENDYLFIKDKTSAVLPYAHYFYSGVFGSGVCILSKYPIEDVFFHPWPLNGYVHKIQHGDWFGGKGVGLCKVRCKGININLYSAHLHAEYNHRYDEYLAHRILQAFNMSQFISLTSSGADLVILAGDLNIEPGNLSYKIICYNAQLKDSFFEAQQKLEDCKGTSDSCQNSYTDKTIAQENPEGCRIDYIMFKPGPGIQVSCLNYQHPLPNKVPEKTFSYSDHEAVAASLNVNRMPDVSGGTALSNEEYMMTMKESISVCDNALMQLKLDKRSYWLYSSILLLSLLGTIGSDVPYNFFKTGNIVRIFFALVLCYTVFMATFWNNTEVNAVLTGKRGMEIIYSKLQHNKQNANDK